MTDDKRQLARSLYFRDVIWPCVIAKHSRDADDTAAGGFEMLMSGIGLVIGLAADFPCLPVAEQHIVTGQRSSDNDGQETTVERRTRLSCATATQQQEGGDERRCFSWEWL